jgi:hypothetical protein
LSRQIAAAMEVEATDAMEVEATERYGDMLD